jgi:catechol 2,3-dioxygenase-like lactoylglutathione lyase family enzyme
VIDARFGHVNLIARDWRSLAAFYTRMLGCELVPPERDYRGAALAAGTGIPGAALRGAHLRLPGPTRRTTSSSSSRGPTRRREIRR